MCRHISTATGRHAESSVQQHRETKLADIHAAAASRAGSRANSINRGPTNGAVNAGAATGVDGAQGPVVPNIGASGAAGPSGA